MPRHRFLLVACFAASCSIPTPALVQEEPTAAEVAALGFVDTAWRRAGLPETTCRANRAPTIAWVDEAGFEDWCGADPYDQELFGACVAGEVWILHDEPTPEVRIQRVLHAAVVDLTACSEQLEDPRTHPTKARNWCSVWSWAWHLYQGTTPPGCTTSPSP